MTESSPPIRLYSFPTSPFAVKVACYLAYKKLDYELVGVSPITFKQVAFTDAHQVPVLKIGEEWKLDSTEIGIWLEQMYPGDGLLGDSPEDREAILEVDNWISHQLIPGMFRLAIDWPSPMIGFRNGWKLSGAIHEVTPMPGWVRFMWGVLIRKAKFIHELVDHTDRNMTLPQWQQKVQLDFIKHLGDGPYLGGRSTPSLADLSAFASIVFPYRLGLQGDARWTENETVREWITAVQRFLPANPFLVSDSLLSRELSLNR